MAAQKFHLDPSGVAALRRRALSRGFGFVGVFIAAYSLFAFATGSELQVSLKVIGIFLIAGSLGIFRASKTLAAQWSSYELITSDIGIIRKMSGHRDLQFERDEIRTIAESQSGDITIRAGDKRIIVVPAAVANRQQLRSILESSHPIEKGTPPRVRPVLLFFFIVLAVIGGYAGAFISTDPRIFGPVGFILGIALLWCFWQLQRSPAVDRRFRMWSWMILFLALCALYRVYQAVFR